MRSLSFLALGLFLSLAACADTETSAFSEPRPTISSATIENKVACQTTAGGGACLLPVSVVFRLPSDQFVQKAWVRFQGDGSDRGVDRGYVLPQTFGRGPDVDVKVVINANIPGEVLNTALLTFVVRLETGAGAESTESTLSVQVQ